MKRGMNAELNVRGAMWARGVDAETVDAHFDELAVTFYKIVYNGLVFGVKVNAVACNLSPPAAGFVPVHALATWCQ